MSFSRISLRYGHVSAATGLLIAASLLSGCRACQGEPPPELPQRPQEASAAADNAGDAGPAAQQEQDAGPSRPQRPTTVHAELPTADDFAVSPVEGNWAMFRGNNDRSGLRNAAPITQPSVIWSQEIGIQGYANTTIVTEDALYVSSQGTDHDSAAGTDAGDGVLRLDPATGEIRWRFTTQQDANGMTLVGNTLVVGTDGGALIALDREAGTVRWQAETGCNVYHAPYSDGVNVYLLRRDGVAAWSLEDGQPVGEVPPCRSSDRGALSGSEDGIWAAGDHHLLENFNGTTLRWPVDPPDERLGRMQVWSPPLLTRSMALLVANRWPFGEFVSFDATRPAVFAFWRDNGQLAWTADVNEPARTVEAVTEKDAYLRGLPYVEGNRMYFSPTNRGEIAIYDVTNGQRTGGIALPDCRMRQFSSIVGVPGMAYFARHDGVLYGFSTGDQPALAWQLQLGLHGAADGRNSTAYQPVAGGCDVIPEDGTALFSTPAIGANGTLYVNSGDGWLYAIQQAQ